MVVWNALGVLSFQCAAGCAFGVLLGWRALAARYNPYDHAFLSMKPKPTSIYDLLTHTSWRRLAVKGTEFRALVFVGTRILATRKICRTNHVARLAVYGISALTWSVVLRSTALISSDPTAALVTVPQACRFIARTEGSSRAVFKGTGYALAAVILENETPSIVEFVLSRRASMPSTVATLVKTVAGIVTGLISSRLWLAAECAGMWKPKPIHPRMELYALTGLEMPLRLAAIVSACSANIRLP